MNQNACKNWEGKYVKLDSWPFMFDGETTIGENVKAIECVGKIWYLEKLTKGGMCLLSSLEKSLKILARPSDISEWEYPE